jgi:hypothetical protein
VVDAGVPHRTVPFVAKAVGHPIAKYASLLMAGQTLKEIGLTEVRSLTRVLCTLVGMWMGSIS